MNDQILALGNITVELIAEERSDSIDLFAKVLKKQVSGFLQ